MARGAVPVHTRETSLVQEVYRHSRWCRPGYGSPSRTGRAAQNNAVPLPSPASPGPWSVPGVPQLQRLVLAPTMSRDGMFDGAWWPRSKHVLAELPDLITALSAHLGRIVRVGLDTSAWYEVPRSVAGAGRPGVAGSAPAARRFDGRVAGGGGGGGGGGRGGGPPPPPGGRPPPAPPRPPPRAPPPR
ncbi:DUF5994 family protein, partial [Streptomyces sp. NPDC053086]|uniref:DUF5994 family protein n=1 Tax=Streptomyces sp. NPDC053086 TaxID=3365698 RepID=UPI0037D07F3B